MGTPLRCLDNALRQFKKLCFPLGVKRREKEGGVLSTVSSHSLFFCFLCVSNAMQPSVQALYGLLSLFECMLQSTYAVFYVDRFARCFLSYSSVDGVAASTRRSARLAAKAAKGLRGGQTRAPAQGSVDPLRGAHDPWTALLCLIVAQVAYTAWNVLGDVGVECLGDARRLRALSWRWLHRLTVSGPLWGLSFMALWLPPSWPLLHYAFVFTLCMAVYEGLCSCCAAATTRLLLGETSTSEERDRWNAKASLFSALGSVGLVFASVLYEERTRRGLGGFELLMFVWGTIAGCGLHVVGRLLRGGAVDHRAEDGGAARLAPLSPPRCRECSLTNAGASFMENSPGPKRGGGADFLLASGSSVFEASPLQRFLGFAGQTLGRSSMKAVMALWALQEFNRSATTHFFGLYIALVCSHTMAPSVRAVWYLLAFVVPQAATAALTPLYPTVGKKKMVSVLLLLRLGVGVATLGLALAVVVRELGGRGPGREGRSVKERGRVARRGAAAALPAGGTEEPRTDSTTSFAFAVLLSLNRALTEVVSGMQSSILSDVCDEDTVIFGRARPMTAATHTLATMVAKPSRTAALVLTSFFLVSTRVLPGDTFTGDGVSAKAAALVILFVSCSAIATSGPMLLLWHRQYTLEGKHLQFVQMALRKRTEDEEVGQV